MTLQLYDFQARGLDAGREAYRSGSKAVLFVGPTGMGKTTLASFASMNRLAKRPNSRIVAIVHRRELLDQMARRLADVGLDVGAFGRNPHAPVQVTSIQTILASRRMPDADFVIVDEAHHYVSDEWIKPLRLYMKMGAVLFGLTATPERDDGRGLGGEDGIFDALITVAQVSELVALNAIEPDKGIVPIEVIAPTESVRKLAQSPVRAWLEHASGRSTVVFAPNVKNAESFAIEFREAGIATEVVHGELDDSPRDSALARFASGEVRVVINVGVLTEGWDCPRCEVCMLARKIGSNGLFMQTVGRARRPAPWLGKRNSMLIDLAGNVDLHGHPDLDREYALEGEGVHTKGQLASGERFCRVCRIQLTPEDVERGFCPEESCKTKISKIVILTPEEVELARVKRDDARAKAHEDTKEKALRTLYLKGLRTSKKRIGAEMVFRKMFGHFPQSVVRKRAWDAAALEVATEKGDAWLPPEEGKDDGAMAS